MGRLASGFLLPREDSLGLQSLMREEGQGRAGMRIEMDHWRTQRGRGDQIEREDSNFQENIIRILEH